MRVTNEDHIMAVIPLINHATGEKDEVFVQPRTTVDLREGFAIDSHYAATHPKVRFVEPLQVQPSAPIED